MYPLYVTAHKREIYSHMGELEIAKSDSLRS